MGFFIFLAILFADAIAMLLFRCCWCYSAITAPLRRLRLMLDASAIILRISCHADAIIDAY